MQPDTFTYHGRVYTPRRAERGWIVESHDGRSGRGRTIVDALEALFGGPLHDPELLTIAINTLAGDWANKDDKAA